MFSLIKEARRTCLCQKLTGTLPERTLFGTNVVLIVSRFIFRAAKAGPKRDVTWPQRLDLMGSEHLFPLPVLAKHPPKSSDEFYSVADEVGLCHDGEHNSKQQLVGVYGIFRPHRGASPFIALLLHSTGRSVVHAPAALTQQNCQSVRPRSAGP